MTDAEIEITADLVRDLLREQHPDLAGLPVREVAGGWGNQMWRLGDGLAVRMQRMDPTPRLQLNERRWLPVLAPHLPLPVPTPVRSGEPSARFPKHWTVMTWVHGEPLDHSSISRGDHAAGTLAGFLKALHVEAPADAPVSGDRGGHPRTCTDGFDRFFHAVVPGDLADDVRAVWDDAVAAPEWEGPPLWVHGDLHPANVVVSEAVLFPNAVCGFRWSGMRLRLWRESRLVADRVDGGGGCRLCGRSWKRGGRPLLCGWMSSKPN